MAMMVITEWSIEPNGGTAGRNGTRWHNDHASANFPLELLPGELRHSSRYSISSQAVRSDRARNDGERQP
jgi:hypothetical protein